jgi:hypothetical protein
MQLLCVKPPYPLAKRILGVKSIGHWEELSHYGIVMLSHERYAAAHYVLCEVTAEGKKTLERALGVARLPLQRHGRQFLPDNRSMGSIMLAPGLLPVICIYALLDSGCHEVWLTQDGQLIGIEPTDSAAVVDDFLNRYGHRLVRSYSYADTADGAKQHLTVGWLH